jgi:hypothetical protein
MARLWVFMVLLPVGLSSVLLQSTSAGEEEATRPSPDRSVADNASDSVSQATEASQKWFITVLTRKDCTVCQQMISAFAEHPKLRELANTEDHRSSWANWNVVTMDDRKQSARFRAPYSDLTIKGYPTLLIQPPASGRYGSAHTVVLQKTGYDGNAQKLAQQIKTSIERYAATADQGMRSEAIANRKSTSPR